MSIYEKEEEELRVLKESGEAPEWYTVKSYITVSKGYRLKGETPKGMFKRMSSTVAKALGKPHLEDKFFQAIWNNWLCPATPLSNLGTDKGLPISCFGINVGDSISSITGKIREMAMLTKNGGGVGVNFQNIRPKGTPIKGGANGKTDGIVPFIKMYDSAIIGLSQGSARRGAASANLDIEHGDWSEFIRMRRPEGDVNRQCGNLHHSTCVTDDFMERMLAGGIEEKKKWAELMISRIETGESYIFFKDTINKANPQAYKNNNLEVDYTNICCLTGDTLVATSNGAMPIKDLVGREVKIFDGVNWVKNSSFAKRGETNLLYEIEMKSGQKILSTGNHRWFCADNYEDIRSGKFKEYTSDSLKEGMFLETHSESFHGSLEESGAYLKGFLVGDGTFCKKSNTPKLNLHSTKFSCEGRLLESCLEVCGDDTLRTDVIKTPSFSQVKDFTGAKGTYGAQIYKSMRGLSFRKAELNSWAKGAKSSLPKVVHSWSEKSKLEFLAGLLDADGTYGKSIQIVQKNLGVILDIQLLLNSFGFSSSVDEINGRFRLSISTTDSEKLTNLTNFARIQAVNKKPNRKLTGYRKIKSIRKIHLDKPVDVFCPTVPTTGKFALANGVMTGNSEITLASDLQHTFVCCLSSLNLARWDEWKDTDVVETSIEFLNGVLDEFINRASHIEGFENAVRSAVKGRAIGLGVLGWHTLLQEKMLPFASFQSMSLNNEIFSTIKERAVKKSQELAAEYGSPEWCKGTGMYNTHLLAVAPTRSNSVISGGVSAGIEPIVRNVYADVTAKGLFFEKNPTLVKLLESKGKNTPEVWKVISQAKGSVQGLKFLSENEKNVFKTAYEIDQEAIVRQAAQRQKYICQSQSLNLFFPKETPAKYFNYIHILAWKLGVKTLYYCKSTSGISLDTVSRELKIEDCESCSG